MLSEAGNESLFFFDLVLSFFDEVGGGAFDIAGVFHAGIQGVEFAADGEDFIGKGLFVIIYYLFGHIKIEFMVGES